MPSSAYNFSCLSIFSVFWQAFSLIVSCFFTLFYYTYSSDCAGVRHVMFAGVHRHFNSPKKWLESKKLDISYIITLKPGGFIHCKLLVKNILCVCLSLSIWLKCHIISYCWNWARKTFQYNKMSPNWNCPICNTYRIIYNCIRH